MRVRIRAMRQQLVEKIQARVPGATSFVTRQRGMFSYSGLSKEAVARLRESTPSTPSTPDASASLRSIPTTFAYCADAIAKVIAAGPQKYFGVEAGRLGALALLADWEEPFGPFSCFHADRSPDPRHRASCPRLHQPLRRAWEQAGIADLAADIEWDAH